MDPRRSNGGIQPVGRLRSAATYPKERAVVVAAALGHTSPSAGRRDRLGETIGSHAARHGRYPLPVGHLRLFSVVGPAPVGVIASLDPALPPDRGSI